MHAVLCGAVYLSALCLPMVQYYGAVFLLFELSTILLNVGWFVMNVYDYPSSSLLMKSVNAAFALSFFACRLLYGNYQSYWFFLDMAQLYRSHGFSWGMLLFCSANLLLAGLNFFWFYKIIRMVTKKPKTK